ncbi:MAG: ATP-binding protein [Myxococcota bacterium]
MGEDVHKPPEDGTGDSPFLDDAGFRALFANHPDGIIISDEVGAIVGANRKAAVDLGYSIEELTRLTIPDVDVAWRPASLGFAMAQHAASGSSFTILGRHRRKDGSEYDVEIRSTVFDDRGRVRCVAVVRPLSDQTAFREQLKHKEAQLAEARRLESLGLYSVGVAHDLGNLLTPVILEAEGLKSEEMGESTREGLDVILSATKLAQELIDGLMAFARQSSGCTEPVDLSKLIRGLEGLLKAILRRDIALEVSLPRRPVMVHADAHRVAQSLLNLAVNARDALRGAGRFRVTLEPCRRLGEERDVRGGRLPAGWYAIVRVEDDGPGMAPELLERVFEPFVTTKLGGRGAGLGLATVRDVMVQHRGAVDVTSTVDEGTTFELFFPNELGVEESPFPAARERASRGCLLVVEGDGEVRKALARCLRDLGYRVREAVDGRDGLRRLEQLDEPVDLVIADVAPSELSGEGLFEFVRTSGRELPFVFTTADPPPSPIAASLYGYAILSKPFSPRELDSAVKAALVGRRAEP